MGILIRCALMAAVITTLRAEPKWLTNLDEAKAQAQKENKTILMDFTGSDWCGFCIKLKKAVWDKPEFEKFAEKNLVLVELDFPAKKKLPADLKKANEKLRDEYNIEGYPTIILLDAKGKKLAEMVGYEGDSASEYIQKLEKVIAKQKKASS